MPCKRNGHSLGETQAQQACFADTKQHTQPRSGRVHMKLSLPHIKQHYSCTTQMLDSCTTDDPKTALPGSWARERWQAEMAGRKGKGNRGNLEGRTMLEATAGSCLLGTVGITSHRQVLTHTCNTANTARRMALVPRVDGRSFQAAVHSCMGTGLKPTLQVRVWPWACKCCYCCAAWLQRKRDMVFCDQYHT